MKLTIESSISMQEKIEYIRQSLSLTTSEEPIEGRENIECSNHEEMLQLLQALQYRYECKGENDRFIVLPLISH